RAPFELILIDSDMPEPGGISLVRLINDQETLQSNIIMMLASSSFRSQVDLRELGVKTSIIKPVRPSDLLDAIMIGLGFKVYEAEAPSKMRGHLDQPEGTALKILVAEDTPFNQKFILRLLSRWGYQAVLVENGRLAVEALSREKYDIVLMDIQMPEMDGLEAATAIREAEKKTDGYVPIIALTAHAMKGDRERCIEAGMDEYISKPISPEALHKAIQTLVSEEPREASEKDKKVDVVSSMNMEALLSAFEHDWNFFKEIVDMFISDYPSMMTNIQEAIALADGEKLHRAAHSIKGMLRNFQAEAAAQIAMDLEKMGQDGTFEDAARTYKTLDAELNKLESALLGMLEEIRDQT
ncbi:MAG: response regulator, partial [Deltaproteobacteria bacterium]|nr:response regulator [Deltaproteobacteria bacterium]